MHIEHFCWNQYQAESSENAKEQLEDPCKATFLRGRGGDLDVADFNKSVSDLTGSTNRISLSMATTSFIIGRSSARVLRHRKATARVCSISCICGSALPLNFGSSTSTGSHLLCKWSRTHWTRCAPPGNVGSSGCLPVRTSKRTTPKLYTSLFSVIRCIEACSVNKWHKLLAHHPKQCCNSNTWVHQLHRATDVQLILFQ